MDLHLWLPCLYGTINKGIQSFQPPPRAGSNACEEGGDGCSCLGLLLLPAAAFKRQRACME